MWSMVLNLLGNGHAKFWGSLAIVGFLAGGSCTTVNWRLQTHEKQSTKTVKILTTICVNAAKNIQQTKDCLEE